MKKPDDLGEKILLAAVIFAATRVTLLGTERAWSAVTQDVPPPDQTDREVAVRDEVAWVVLSGLAVGLIRVFVRRSLPEVRRRFWQS